MNLHVPLKPALFVLLSLPLAWLGWQIALEVQAPTSALGADPGEAIVRYLGEWSIRMLLLAFSVTPVRTLLSSAPLARSRRLVGLFAFTYVVLHLLSYLFFYVEFEWPAMVADFTERTYITAGLGAFLCLTLMAVTSTRASQRRLRRNWVRLHKLVYLAITLGLLHLWWLTRDGYAELVIYCVWFAVLLWARHGVDLSKRAVTSQR